MQDVNTLSLAEIDVSQPELFHQDIWQPWFARLRKESPVHYQAESVNGPFWSVTSHELIKEVDANNTVFSSEKGGIAIVDPVVVEAFIAREQDFERVLKSLPENPDDNIISQAVATEHTELETPQQLVR